MTNKRVKNSVMKPSILIKFLIIGVLCISPQSSIVYAQGDYTLVDSRGNEITLPTDIPVYSEKSPGPWPPEAIDFIKPEIVSWVRKDGLEDIRVITVSANNPFSEEVKKNHYIKSFYIVDKDGIIISFRAFSEDLEGPATAKFLINGVINRLDVYVEFAEHSLWKTDLELPFKK